MPKITNTEVYGLERAIRTAKYPKAVDIDKLNSDLTPGFFQAEDGIRDA